MPKVVTTPISAFTQGAIATINQNFSRVQEAMENTLSRDGTIPNQMTADLDMNDNDILNVNNIDVKSISVDGGVLDIQGAIDEMSDILNQATLEADRSEQEADRSEQERESTEIIRDEIEELAQMVANSVPHIFDTRAEALLFNPPIAPDFIEVMGVRFVIDDGETNFGQLVQIGTGDLYKPMFGEIVPPELFGAIPGVVSSGQRTSNTTNLKAWVRYCSETGIAGQCLNPYYETDDPIGSNIDKTEAKVVLSGVKGGTTIKHVSSTAIGQMCRIYGSLSVVQIQDLVFDGGDKASGGFVGHSIYGLANMLALRCFFNNGRTPHYTVVGSHAAGIRLQISDDVTPYGGLASIIDCGVKTMLKDTQAVEPNSMANQGLVIAGFRQSVIRSSSAEDIRTDDIAKIDADGLVVFSRRISGIYQPMDGEVAYNSVKNCAGRFIKTQVDGLHIHHNELELKGAIELAGSFRAIDSQVGSCRIEDNSMVSDALWTGGSEAVFVLAQSPSANPTTTKRTMLEVRRNRLETAKQFYEFLSPNLSNQEDFTEWVFEDNEASWTGSGSTAAINVASTIRYTGATKSYAIRYRRNRVSANNLILQTASSGAGDKTSIMALDIIDNVNTFGSNFIFATPSNCWTSNLLVRGGDTGDSSGVRIQQSALDLTKVRAGSDFMIGTGTITGGIGSSMNGMSYIKTSKTHSYVYSSSANHWTVDGGVTWNSIYKTTLVSKVFDPPSLAASATTSTVVDTPGIAVASFVQLGFTQLLQGVTARYEITEAGAAGKVTVTFKNETASTVDLPSLSIYVRHVIL